MKLKPVVASLVMLGLIAPVFAKSNLVAQQAVVDSNSVTSPVASEGWFNRVSIGGVGSIVGIGGNHSPAGVFTKENNSADLYVNNFNLLANANLSSWSKATLNVAYIGNPIQWGNTKHRNINNIVAVDEAYVHIGDLAQNPFYFVVGKKYVPFGTYADAHTPYQIMSPVQALTQLNAVTAIAGLSTNFGLYGSVYALRGETYPIGSSTSTIRNFGAQIGYYNSLEPFNVPNANYNLNVGYLNNLWDTIVFSPNATTPWSWSDGYGTKLNHPVAAYATKNDGKQGSAIDPVGGIAVHGDINYKALTLSANFASALKKMVTSDYSNKADSSRFWAADVGATYAFKTLDRNSHLGAGIQWSGNGSWFGDNNLAAYSDWCKIIPKWRLLGEYKINLFKNTDLGLVVAHSKSYDFVTGASNNDPAGGRNTTLGLARLMVQF